MTGRLETPKADRCRNAAVRAVRLRDSPSMQLESSFPTNRPLTPDEIPDRPRVDRWWSADEFADHIAAEGIECHAKPRFGGPPVLGVALAGVVAKLGLKLADDHDDIEI